jgi:hypothetical protein
LREKSPIGSQGTSLKFSSSSRATPLKQDEEEELVRAFKEQLDYEKNVEDIRIQLANQPDFNLMDAFNMLDY